MTSRISYMGTKHELAPAVRDVLRTCQPGLVLDAFAGMGAVAESLADERQVWTNDVQHFAHLATACRIADEYGPLSARVMARLARPLFRANLGVLFEQNGRAIRMERKAFRAENFASFSMAFQRATSIGLEHDGAYGCFTKTYSYGYFSVEQCTHIDSIRYALEMLRGTGAISASQFRWGLLALGAASLRVANTTGHFAQYLKPSPMNYRRVLKQFVRNVWSEWLASISRMQPVGTPIWRRENLSTREDSTILLRSNKNLGRAKVVYCDPPYTNDQYSRYYHVWETLVLYDYPQTVGQGRYRQDRFTTDFSLSSKVVEAFEELIRQVAETGADLILSYPSNGLIHSAGKCPLELMRERYPKARVAREINHNHSTMGASKGPAKAAVRECLYVGCY